MASWSAAVAYTEAPPAEAGRESRPRARRRRDPLRSGVVWIVVAAAVLAGLVALNVAVLQLNVRLDQLSRDRGRELGCADVGVHVEEVHEVRRDVTAEQGPEPAIVRGARGAVRKLDEEVRDASGVRTADLAHRAHAFD